MDEAPKWGSVPEAGAPKQPEGLRVSHDMWVAMLCDPVMAAFVIFGVRLDAFQAARLRKYWWGLIGMDNSGVGSGKTIVIFLFVGLRCILLPDQVAAIYYPTFGTGKNEFWEYFARFALSRSAPVFQSQLGNPLKMDAGDEVAGDGTTHGPDCYKAFFRNGNRLLMPAPSFAKDAVTQASLSLNTLVIEEWWQVDAASDGINKQLIDRARRPSWNQFHPIWGNHILFSGHAQTLMHPGAARYKAHARQAAAGNPIYVNMSYSYKDYSRLISEEGRSFQDKYRNEVSITTKRNSSSSAAWLGQGLGIVGMSGTGWFTEEAILRAQANGRAANLMPVMGRRQWEESVK